MLRGRAGETPLSFSPWAKTLPYFLSFISYLLSKSRGGHRPPVAANPTMQPNGETARASNARPYNVGRGIFGQKCRSGGGLTLWNLHGRAGETPLSFSPWAKTLPYFLSFISYLLSKSRGGHRPPAAANPTMQPNGQTARASNARPYNVTCEVNDRYGSVP